MEGRIKQHRKLLQDIADGLKANHNVRVHDLQVRMYSAKEADVVLVRDVPTALDYLANDIWWDENGEWADACEARVEVT